MYCATAPWKTAIIYAEGLSLFFKENFKKNNNNNNQLCRPPVDLHALLTTFSSDLRFASQSHPQILRRRNVGLFSGYPINYVLYNALNSCS